MAMSDYRLCDHCGGKAFYDSNLNYESSVKVGDKWVYPANAFRINGEVEPYGLALDRLGDWAVICSECSKSFKCVVVPMSVAEAERKS